MKTIKQEIHHDIDIHFYNGVVEIWQGLAGERKHITIEREKLPQLIKSLSLSEREQPVKDEKMYINDKFLRWLWKIENESQSLVHGAEDEISKSVAKIRLQLINKCITEYSRLSPSKEKWISEPDWEKLFKDGWKRVKDVHDNHGYFGGMDNWSVLKQVFEPVSGDNKKGEG